MKNTTQDQYAFFEEELTDNTLILTGTDENARTQVIKEGLSEYQILYMTQNYALWAKRGSSAFAQLSEQMSARVESLERAKTEIVSEDELLEEEGISLLEESESESGSAAEQESKLKTETESETETGSESESESESESNAKTDETKKKRENKKETYGKKLYLAPGTYRMEFYFTGSVDADTDGKITVSDKEGTILTRTFVR